MDPKQYCQQAMRELRKATPTAAPTQHHQRVVVLAYFADVPPTEQDFATQLKRLAESSERSGRIALATAAREVLADWEERRAMPVGAVS